MYMLGSQIPVCLYNMSKHPSSQQYRYNGHFDKLRAQADYPWKGEASPRWRKSIAYVVEVVEILNQVKVPSLPDSRPKEMKTEARWWNAAIPDRRQSCDQC
ncbi:hypothetical protein AGABI2DRAFT_193791 [Agaricus bisporus var. bisporus H97]|uniref:hypothetical protein n=1 Tax=Agaricus bisporus var. bisporus (strain H97 / ATCC MYA-4626 / FGSC 10389) TaxID=936046 RepID=UPI00029F6939|nr:hypothetical protein AGABI2DRAFT_193791 [Agaricus bisporus var. bisporus H97]EKV45867.1 hypothetical protein AGABI2DRAFT_193791 [Agaricus bisporus var. bisporus H97]